MRLERGLGRGPCRRQGRLLPRFLDERRFDEAPLAVLARFATSLMRLAHFDSIDLDQFIADGTVSTVAGLALKIYDLRPLAARPASLTA